MAQKRMINRKITETDLFLDMPLSSQCFYFHLNMGADDEGFIDNVRTIQRMVGASHDDLKLLITKNFLIPFESGVVVIKDWKIHNYIAKDRFTKTLHQEERSQITLDENNSYTNCIQDVDGLYSQSSIALGKGSVGKSSSTIVEHEVETEKKEPKDSVEQTPPYDQIIDYLNYKLDSQYRHTTKSTQRLINARYSEGYNLDDFKTVINIKADEWVDTDMSKFLRPETLFSTKFEGYLNQPRPKKKVKEESVYKNIGVY